jgi:hypothetical protein
MRPNRSGGYEALIVGELFCRGANEAGSQSVRAESSFEHWASRHT